MSSSEPIPETATRGMADSTVKKRGSSVTVGCKFLEHLLSTCVISLAIIRKHTTHVYIPPCHLSLSLLPAPFAATLTLMAV
jgi:hypothetical protein